MSLEGYKKWIIAALLIIINGVIIYALIASYYSTEKPSDESSNKTTYPSGPIIDSNIKKESLQQMEKMPDDPGSLAILGDRHFENSKFKEAIDIYEKVLKLNPNDVDTYNDLGLAYHYMGRSDIAIDKLRKGTEVIPSYQRIWLSLGFVLVSTGRNEEAKVALKKAIDLAPDSVVGQEAKRMLGIIK